MEQTETLEMQSDNEIDWDSTLSDQGLSMQDVQCVGDCTHCPVREACDF